MLTFAFTGRNSGSHSGGQLRYLFGKKSQAPGPCHSITQEFQGSVLKPLSFVATGSHLDLSCATDEEK